MELEQLKSQLTGFLKANREQIFTAQNLADGLRMTDSQGYKPVSYTHLTLPTTERV